jgi:hypothetical protein
LHLPVLDFDRLSPLEVPEPQSAFLPHAQRNAFPLLRIAPESFLIAGWRTIPQHVI